MALFSESVKIKWLNGDRHMNIYIAEAVNGCFLFSTLVLEKWCCHGAFSADWSLICLFVCLLLFIYAILFCLRWRILIISIQIRFFHFILNSNKWYKLIFSQGRFEGAVSIRLNFLREVHKHFIPPNKPGSGLFFIHYFITGGLSSGLNISRCTLAWIPENVLLFRWIISKRTISILCYIISLIASYYHKLPPLFW